MGQRSVIALLSQLVMAVDDSLLSSIITVRPPYPTHMIVHGSAIYIRQAAIYLNIPDTLSAVSRDK